MTVALHRSQLVAAFSWEVTSLLFVWDCQIQLFIELAISLNHCLILLCDNQSSDSLAQKHIEINVHFICGTLKVQYVPTKYQRDILTKALSSSQFAFLRSKLAALSL